MTDGNSRDKDDSPARPVQIPLLEDIVDAGAATRRVLRNLRRLDHSPDLQPEPAPTHEPFDADLPESPASQAPDDRDHGVEDAPTDAGDIDVTALFDGAPVPASRVPWSVVDETFTVDAEPMESAEEREARLRAGANRVVDNLVREYSEEIVRRLRDELSALLDDLDTSTDPP